MKKSSFMTIFAVFALCLVISALPFLSAQSGIVTESGSTGFNSVATQNLTIATATPTIIGTMPPACRKITVTALNATMYYGDANVTTDGLYPCITSGNSVTFDDNSTRNPTIYFRALATATGKIGISAR